MRFVVARRSSRRGEGFGNELLPWAKGAIASQVLDATLVGPAWGLNKRQYWRNFRTSRFDFVLEDALRALPHVHFCAEDYYATGETAFGDAVRAWALGKGLFQKKHFIVEVDGMYGGYFSVRQAKSFLLSKLLSSRDAIRNVYEVDSRLKRDKLFAAVHMRLGGDFHIAETGENVRGRYNIRLPAGWYMKVCSALQDEFGEHLEFRFFTDRKDAAFAEAVQHFNPQQREQQGSTECSDLLLMAQADLRICSVSSYSMAACMLGDGPYLWYEPQLNLQEGMYSLWGQEDRQRAPGSPTRRGFEHVRDADSEAIALGWKGFPIGSDGELPRLLVDQLWRMLAIKDPRRNLIEYGCVPEEVVCASRAAHPA